MRKLSALNYVILAILFLGATAHAADKPALNVKKLVATCQSGWAAHNAQMEDLRKASEKWLKEMPTTEFDKLDDAEDPMLILVSYTWPSLIEKHDQSWKTYSTCSDRHIQLLRLQMNDMSRDRKADVAAWSDCVRTLNSAGKKPLPSPLKELQTCYEAQAAAFKE